MIELYLSKVTETSETEQAGNSDNTGGDDGYGI